jgi:ATP-dependent 26S proteasome regulatory subunit
MNTTITNNWHEANQHYLSAALAYVRGQLEQHVQKVRATSVVEMPSTVPDTEPGTPAGAPDTVPITFASNDNTTSSPALEALCAAFSLSPFERDVLLMCAGIELDSTFAALCAAAQDDPLRAYPTFGLALAALREAHWSALAPNAPLRRWRLIEANIGNALTTNPLHIDERVLHYLTGLQYLDERLAGIIEPLQIAGDLAPSHLKIAQQLVSTWSQAEGVLPVVQLCGSDVMGKRAIVAAACDGSGLNLCVISAHSIPSSPVEFDAFTRLWERESVLSSSALLLDCDEIATNDSSRERCITRLIESIRGVLIVSSRERRHALQRAVITIDVQKLTPGEQRAIWQSALGDVAHNLNGKVEMLVSQFNMSTSTIASTSAEVLGGLADVDTGASVESDVLAHLLWDTCRVQVRSRLDDLAQRIEPVATWDELVLPELQRQVLRDSAMHVKQRATVYETWGFASKGARGLGISALFAGVSGTGKTMAAEVLANELRLDLYRIDLSQVVSKYIGETEKNLRRVFDAAEEGGAILLFDEADALFGKRSEIKDSHDRYANIEVSYLLQRMEAYRGLAILTTNMKSALDSAFLRRIRFIVEFPFPDAAQRGEIWRRIFPASTPTDGLDIPRLARLNITGGNIRNIALNAAFLAADGGSPVRMTHLLRATRSEYAKLEKSLTEAEIGGWV